MKFPACVGCVLEPFEAVCTNPHEAACAYHSAGDSVPEKPGRLAHPSQGDVSAKTPTILMVNPSPRLRAASVKCCSTECYALYCPQAYLQMSLPQPHHCPLTQSRAHLSHPVLALCCLRFLVNHLRDGVHEDSSNGNQRADHAAVEGTSAATAEMERGGAGAAVRKATHVQLHLNRNALLCHTSYASSLYSVQPGKVRNIQVVILA